MKTLVAYFSTSGITKEVAHTLTEVANADIYEIIPQEPYSRAGLDWTNEQNRSTLECKAKWNQSSGVYTKHAILYLED